MANDLKELSAKHTPAPWNVTDDTQEIFSGISVVASMTNETGGFYNNAKANAEFIVRACNAHDELVELAQWIADDSDAPPYLRRKARAAIAKARGEE